MNLTTTLQQRIVMRAILSGKRGSRKQMRTLARAAEALPLEPEACGMDPETVERLNYSFNDTDGVTIDPERQKELSGIEVSSEIDPAVADGLLEVLDEYEGWTPYDVKWVDEVCVQLMGVNGGKQGRRRSGKKAG